MDNSIIILISSGLSMACLLLCTERHTTGKICAVASDLTLTVEDATGRRKRFKQDGAPTDQAPETVHHIRNLLLGKTARCTHGPFISRNRVISARIQVLAVQSPSPNTLDQIFDTDLETFLLIGESGHTV